MRQAPSCPPKPANIYQSPTHLLQVSSCSMLPSSSTSVSSSAGQENFIFGKFVVRNQIVILSHHLASIVVRNCSFACLNSIYFVFTHSELGIYANPCYREVIRRKLNSHPRELQVNLEKREAYLPRISHQAENVQQFLSPVNRHAVQQQDLQSSALSVLLFA